MKKFTVILLLIVYSLASIGAVARGQYCCIKPNSSCSSSTMKMNCEDSKTHKSTNDCCDKKQVLINLSSDQEAVKIFFPLLPLHVNDKKAFNSLSFSSLRNNISIVTSTTPGSPPIFLLNRVFRI